MTTSQLAYDATGDNVHRLVDLNPFAIGGYMNGAVTRYIWTPAQWQEFPAAYHIHINVTGDPHVGNCLDVEQGDATPSLVPGWINTRLGETADPLLVYCNRSNLADVIKARAQTKWHGKVWIWIATLDGTLITDRGMTQVGQLRDGAGAYADLSIIKSGALIKAMAARVGKQHP